MNIKFQILFWLSLLLSGCMPNIHPPGDKLNPAQLHEQEFIAEDGAILPLQNWFPATKPQAVIIALHGFNDYSHFFQQPALYFQQQNIASYAYDLRGFGNTKNRGLWAGTAAYVADLKAFIQLIAQRHPNTPVYLVGESMGGAVIIVAATEFLPNVAGIILVAPAVWSRDTMPWYQNSLLWLLSHTVPWMTLTGKGVKVQASDNIDWLRALGRDPLVIKATRVEAVHGLANLMDAAMEKANAIQLPTLMLYGEKDQLIPMQPTRQFINKFLQSPVEQKLIGYYPKGYHLLLHDLQAAVVWQDIVHWIFKDKSRLLSGAEKNALEIHKNHQKL